MSKPPYQSLSEAERKYADIIHLPHHRSLTHTHMSLYDRAAQFAPFAALTGYDDMVSEQARYVDRKIALGEDERDELNRTLIKLSEHIAEGIYPDVSITYFIPDAQKEGGSYITINDTPKRIDPLEQKLILKSHSGPADINLEISIDDILKLEII